MSVYIHNNPKDIRGYRKTAEEYKFCSFGIYAGKTQNKHDILDPLVILSYFSNKITLKRNISYKKIITYVSTKLGISSYNLYIKYNRNSCEF
ncbi:hypothetical protein SH2C18_37810 [Clostridium sediminicola]